LLSSRSEYLVPADIDVGVHSGGAVSRGKARSGIGSGEEADSPTSLRPRCYDRRHWKEATTASEE
jgi:hypothetical protein